MHKDTTRDVGILLLISLLLLFEFKPFGFIMIPMELAIVVCLTLAAMLAFTTLFWGNQVKDERDVTHKQKAGELSFLLGSLTLIIGMVIQLLSHSLDKFLTLTLAVMVFTKIITRIILRNRG